MAFAVAFCSLVATLVAAVAPAPRLDGRWTVTLSYTVAEGLRDRAVGDRFVETWTFRPQCRTGPCRVVLHRAGRAIRLQRNGSTYRGRSSFEGSTTCNGRTYEGGAVYVERWLVRVTASASRPRGRRAVRIAGLGDTFGRSKDTLPCAHVVSHERVALRGAPD